MRLGRGAGGECPGAFESHGEGKVACLSNRLPGECEENEGLVEDDMGGVGGEERQHERQRGAERRERNY